MPQARYSWKNAVLNAVILTATPYSLTPPQALSAEHRRHTILFFLPFKSSKRTDDRFMTQKRTDPLDPFFF